MTGLGVDDVGIGAVSDYKSSLSPKIETIFPQAKSMIVMAFKELSNCESENKRIAMSGRMDLMELMKSCNYKLARFLEREASCKAMSTPLSYPLNMSREARYGLVADFSQSHAAIAAGLGNWGSNNLALHPKFGARVLFATVLCEAQLPPDPPFTEDLCLKCDVCVEGCSGHALDEEGKTDEMKCMKHSQPFGIGANMLFWGKFMSAAPEEWEKMITSSEYMSLYQSQMIGFQYFCFHCLAKCPVGD